MILLAVLAGIGPFFDPKNSTFPSFLTFRVFAPFAKLGIPRGWAGLNPQK